MQVRFLGRSLPWHLETALVVCVVGAAFVIQLLVPHKLIAVNFFFLPTVAAAYFFGAKNGGLTALFSFLIIAAYAVASPERFLFDATPWLLVCDLAVWGAFLGLTAITIGSLCEDRQRQMHKIKSAYVGVLEILAKFLESADHYTKGHSVRVAELSVAIANELQLHDDEVENVRAGALLHDIGKVESIELVKQAATLTDGEKKSLDAHTVRGAELVRPVGAILQEAVPVILYHHHPFGGGKDESGPVGEQIPIGARIVAVADAYDAIVTDRPYRKGRAPWQALAEIEKCAGSHFDPAVVAALHRVLPTDWIQPERNQDELSRQVDEMFEHEQARMKLELVR